MFDKLNEQEIVALMKRRLVGHIGCYADGVTYVVPVSYVYEDDLVYVHSLHGMKIEFMRKNPNVCFQVDDTHNLANWQCVICQGIFEECEDEQSRKQAFSKLNERILPVINSETMHLTAEWPFSSNEEQRLKGIFFRIRITGKTGRFEKSEEREFFAT